MISPAAYFGQDMSADKLIENLREERFSGKPIDIDSSDADLKSLLARLEALSGLSFDG